MEQNPSNLFELQIDQHSNSYLAETAKWAKFLSIVGFIMCGFIVLIGIFAGSIFASMSSSTGTPMPGGIGAVMGVAYVLIALLYFFPCLYLFRFSTAMQVALRNNDQQNMVKGFSNLKSCFKFLGILTLVMLCIYALALVFGGLGAAIGSM